MYFKERIVKKYHFTNISRGIYWRFKGDTCREAGMLATGLPCTWRSRGEGGVSTWNDVFDCPVVTEFSLTTKPQSTGAMLGTERKKVRT